MMNRKLAHGRLVKWARATRDCDPTISRKPSDCEAAQHEQSSESSGSIGPWLHTMHESKTSVRDLPSDNLRPDIPAAVV